MPAHMNVFQIYTFKHSITRVPHDSCSQVPPATPPHPPGAAAHDMPPLPMQAPQYAAPVQPGVPPPAAADMPPLATCSRMQHHLQPPHAACSSTPADLHLHDPPTGPTYSHPYGHQPQAAPFQPAGAAPQPAAAVMPSPPMQPPHAAPVQPANGVPPPLPAAAAPRPPAADMPPLPMQAPHAAPVQPDMPPLPVQAPQAAMQPPAMYPAPVPAAAPQPPGAPVEPPLPMQPQAPATCVFGSWMPQPSHAPAQLPHQVASPVKPPQASCADGAAASANHLPSELHTLKRAPLLPTPAPAKKPRLSDTQVMMDDAISENTIDTSSSSPDPLVVIEGLQVHDLSLLIYTKHYFVHMYEPGVTPIMYLCLTLFDIWHFALLTFGI